MMKKTLLTVLGLMLIPAVCFAVSVTATVDRNRMSEDDILTLTVTVTDAEGDVDMSAVKDFRIVAHSTGVRSQWVNGNSSRDYIHTYSLAPMKKGRFTIPSLSLRHEGKTYRTDPIVILVEAAGQGNEGEDRDIFVEASVNDALPYVGQQIVYDFTLYFAVQIDNASLKTPDFKGFLVKDTNKDQSFSTVINGREYNVIQRKIVLEPLSAGTIDIPPSVLSCDKLVRSRQQSRDPFDSIFASPFGRTQRIRKVFRTQPLELSVMALPANPHDVTFSGFVGQLSLMGDIDKKDLAVGDSATFTLTVEGTGNLSDMDEPVIEVPDGIKMYRDNPEESIGIGPEGFTGKKVYRMALVPVKDGPVTLPPVRVNYFDVEQGEYRVLETEAVDLAVKPSKTPAVVLGSAMDDGQGPEQSRPRFKKKVEYTGRDILPLKDSLSAVAHRPGLPVLVFLGFLVVPVLMVGVLKLFLIHTGRGQSLGSRMSKRAEEALKHAARPQASDEDFLSGLYKAFVSAVFARASVQGETLTRAEVEKILGTAGVSEDRIREAQDLLEKIESTRFSGSVLSPDARRHLMDLTRQTLRRIR